MAKVYNMQDEKIEMSKNEKDKSGELKLSTADFYELSTYLERIQKLNLEMKMLEMRAGVINEGIKGLNTKKEEILARLGIPKEKWNSGILNEETKELSFR